MQKTKSMDIGVIGESNCSEDKNELADQETKMKTPKSKK
jgi:hypothetical protein